MISESELKEICNRFDRLKLASGLKCPDCGTYKKIYLDTIYLHNCGLIPIEDNRFLNCLLDDLTQHIRENHPDRWIEFEKFIKGDK